MKNKHSWQLWFFSILGLILAALTIYISFSLYKNSYFDSLNTILTFSIGILSLIISAVALFIALVTYSSIDSVNVISSMEGNVLCNENYNAEYSFLVGKYKDCRTQEQLEQAMFDNLYHNTVKPVCSSRTVCRTFWTIFSGMPISI